MKLIKRKAFTLVEIAVAIIVIGVLIAGISQAMEMFAEASLKSARNLSKSSRLGRVDDLTIWFDATSEKAFENEKGDSSAVSIWKDANPKSNLAISSTSSSASLYPSYTLSAINSLPAVSFKKTSSSVGNCVTVPNESFVNSSEDFTLYLIYNPKSLDDGIIIEKNNASATTFPFSLELLSGSYKFSVKNSAETISVTSPKQAIIKTPNLIRLSRVKGSQIEIVIDGVSTTQSDTLTSSTLNNAELAIGCRNGATPANFVSGDFGETAFFNRNINVKEKADIEEYLYKKWKMKKFEGTLPAVTAPAPAITCIVPNANTNSDGNSVGLTTTATSLTCKTGFTGSPTYTCTGANNPGNYLAGGTPCTAITCTAPASNGYLAQSLLAYKPAGAPGAITCDQPNYKGSVSYTCTASGQASVTGSCTACTTQYQKIINPDFYTNFWTNQSPFSTENHTTNSLTYQGWKLEADSGTWGNQPLEALLSNVNSIPCTFTSSAFYTDYGIAAGFLIANPTITITVPSPGFAITKFDWYTFTNHGSCSTPKDVVFEVKDGESWRTLISFQLPTRYAYCPTLHTFTFSNNLISTSYRFRILNVYCSFNNSAKIRAFVFYSSVCN